MTLVGLGYRQPLANWVRSSPTEIECLEITAEHFFDQSEEAIAAVTADRPVFVHGLGLSLGTPGPLDPETLRNFQRVVKASNPAWISEHLAFTRTAEVDLGHLNPVAPTKGMLDHIIENAIALSEACSKPLILENITSHIRMPGEMDEPEFMNELCSKAGCGLLLDVTNLYINSKNHGFDPVEWLQQLNPTSIVQLHIVGYSFHDGRWHDSHQEPIQDELLELCHTVIEYADVKAVILERDENFPEPEILSKELRKIRAICHVV